MTTNKQFNTYKEGLDLEFLREYCMEHGERRTFLRGETLEEAGEPAQWVAFVERGCFKYLAHNDEEGKDYCTGFAFEGEFVADFPYCLDGDVSGHPASLLTGQEPCAERPADEHTGHKTTNIRINVKKRNKNYTLDVTF